MKVDVVIVNYNTKELLKDCLESIYRQKWQHDYTVWVVDNASSDGSVEMVRKRYKQVKIVEAGMNLGFSRGNNVVLDQTKADYCLLLNSDTMVLEGSLDGLVDFAKGSQYRIVSCSLANADGSFQPNAGDRPTLLSIFDWLSGLDDLVRWLGVVIPSFHQSDRRYYSKDREVGWVSGSVMLIKASVIQRIGGLDQNIFMYVEDVEYCVRAAKSGFKVGWTNNASIIHLGGASSQDPHFNQWLGEIRGLLYLAKKNGSVYFYWLLKLMFYVFLSGRVVAFWLLGRRQVARTYVKVISAI